MKVNCACCGAELDRKPCRAKGRNYCNARCQMNYEYSNGIRDRKKTIEKFHSIGRQLTRAGKHPLQQAESRNKLKEIMQTSEYREKQRIVHLGQKNGMYHIYGERHPQYRHGNTILHKLLWGRVEYQEWRKAVYERDNYTCQICGDDRGGNLEAHHVRSFKDFPELRYDTDNGVTLCKACHRELHKKVALTIMPILIK